MLERLPSFGFRLSAVGQKVNFAPIWICRCAMSELLDAVAPPKGALNESVAELLEVE